MLFIGYRYVDFRNDVQRKEIFLLTNFVFGGGETLKL